MRHVPQGRLARRLHAALAPGRRRRAVLTAPHLAGGRQLPTFSFSSRQPVPRRCSFLKKVAKNYSSNDRTDNLYVVTRPQHLELYAADSFELVYRRVGEATTGWAFWRSKYKKPDEFVTI